MITAPADVAAIHKNSASLVFDGFIKDVMITMGAKQSTVDKLYLMSDKKQLSPSERELNPAAKHFTGLIHDRYLTQLSPGERLESLKSNFLQCLDDGVRMGRLPEAAILSKTPQTQRLSLLKLCRDVVIRANTDTLFGEKLLQINPDLPEIFCTFDDDHRMMLYRMPRFMARHVHAAQKKVQETFITYLNLPHEERPGEAWLITQRQSAFHSKWFDCFYDICNMRGIPALILLKL